MLNGTWLGPRLNELFLGQAHVRPTLWFYLFIYLPLDGWWLGAPGQMAYISSLICMSSFSGLKKILERIYENRTG
jgi:hypothetical protein